MKTLLISILLLLTSLHFSFGQGKYFGGNGSGSAVAELSNQPLPVELRYFEALKVASHVSLSWATATELNNDHFKVERSLDGIRFTVIGTVAAQDQSQLVKTYQLTDFDPLEGINYYRLIQVDIDGTRTYYDTIIVDFFNEFDVAKISPNPFHDKIKIETNNANLAVAIYTISGQIVYQAKSVSPSLNTSELKNGLYFILIGNRTFKIVKE